MTSSTRSQPKPNALLADRLAGRADVRKFAAKYPVVPERIAEIVRWLEVQMRDEGLALVVEKLDAAAVQSDAWTKRFGLTPAEARLAAYLLSGGATADYAAERNLSMHTVRNQLRSIYAKTNTNRQVSLLQLLLRASGKNP